MKKLLLFCFLSTALGTFSQNVGINSTAANPDASAMLDVVATDKGVLVPRLALTSAIVAAPVTSPATGLLVYNTATAGVTPNDVVPGFYFWDAVKWQRVVSTTYLNSAAITAIGKFYVNGININNNTVLTLNVTDANVVLGSQISGSFVGLLPGTNVQNVYLRIANIQTSTGSFVMQIINTSGINYTGLSVAYTAFY